MKKIAIAFILLLDITLMCCCRGYSESVWQEKYDLGERYLQSGEYEQAVITFAELIEIDEKRSEGYIKSAEAYVALGQTDQAKEMLVTGAELSSDQSAASENAEQDLYRLWVRQIWDPIYEQAVQLKENEEYGQALQLLKSLIQLDSTQPESYRAAAEIYLKLEDITSACEIMEQGYQETNDSSVNPKVLNEDWAEMWAYDELIVPEELTLGQVPFYQTTCKEVEAYYPGGLFGWSWRTILRSR